MPGMKIVRVDAKGVFASTYAFASLLCIASSMLKDYPGECNDSCPQIFMLPVPELHFVTDIHPTIFVAAHARKPMNF